MANEILWIVINSMIRINAVLFLKRVFLFVGSLLIMALSCLYGLVAVLVASLMYHPIAAAWDSSINGTCANQVVSYLLLEILGALIDLVIVALPAALIRKLPMSLKRKMKGVTLLSAGVVYAIFAHYLGKVRRADEQPVSLSLPVFVSRLSISSTPLILLFPVVIWACSLCWDPCSASFAAAFLAFVIFSSIIENDHRRLGPTSNPDLKGLKEVAINCFEL